MDTPSPELRKTQLSRLTTPKSVARRKILNSPAFRASRAFTDLNELSMSPLQLLDSPAQASVMTPSTSSGESSGTKSPQFLKQTSTPSNGMGHDTPTNRNKAFIIASNDAFVSIKAKRRLIDEELDPQDSPQNLSTKNKSPLHGNASKKQKMTPKAAMVVPKFSRGKKKSFGKINFGVSHRIRKPEMKKVKPSVLSISLSDLKKAKANGVNKHPLDSLNKTLPTSEERINSSSSLNGCIVKEAESVSKVEPRKPVQIPSTPKAHVPASVKQDKKAVAVSPKLITRNWNQRYRKDTRERKFFKSRGTEEDNSSQRVVTVSVNDNLKLQIQEKPAVPIRKSPRKSPAKRMTGVPVIGNDTNIAVLTQDWDEDTADSMDISTNIQDILNGLSEEESLEKSTDAAVQDLEGKEQVIKNKLFPLFYNNAAQPPKPNNDNRATKKINPKSQWIRALNDGNNQMILDAGQKEYGAVQCPECMMVYHVKDPEDELLHAGIHESVNDTLKFSGWKKERVVRRFNSEGYIISVHHGDPAYCLKKVENVLQKVVDHELGFSEIGIRNPETTKVYLYIAEKKIVGVLVAQSLSSGYRMLPSGTASSGKCCSSDPVPALCGVSRIWTLASFRRRKTASRLLDAMRTDFIYGKVVTVDELAFSDPTENGLIFAQSYTQRQDFLVYKM